MFLHDCPDLPQIQPKNAGSDTVEQEQEHQRRLSDHLAVEGMPESLSLDAQPCDGGVSRKRLKRADDMPSNALQYMGPPINVHHMASPGMQVTNDLLWKSRLLLVKPLVCNFLVRSVTGFSTPCKQILVSLNPAVTKHRQMFCAFTKHNRIRSLWA